MDARLASETDALQLDALFGAPGGRALPLAIRGIRMIRALPRWSWSCRSPTNLEALAESG